MWGVDGKARIHGYSADDGLIDSDDWDVELEVGDLRESSGMDRE